ncbi:MAG: ribonuclease III [Bdellovibrionales bacterium]|nr:ribonuclease III [Bdellovibrionales bacterium]
MNDTPSIQSLQEQLRYTFGDPRLLLLSLTHVSFGHENHQDRNPAQRDNERFEFLGDAVLSLVISDLLLEAFPEASEGQVSKMRAAVVNEKTLSEISRSLQLNFLLRLGKGETRSGGAEKPSILSSAFEALIAAIYIDGGFNAVYPVVRYLFAPLFRQENAIISFQDHKTRLQETVQSKFKLTPTYHLVGSTGPDHAKVFSVEVRVGEKVLAVGDGSSKKDAEQRAAQVALVEIEGSAEREPK